MDSGIVDSRIVGLWIVGLWIVGNKIVETEANGYCCLLLDLLLVLVWRI